MVLDFYNLREQPFGVTPDARFLYLSATHREALASVRYGVATGRGFVALIAKPGMGKTTLLFEGLKQLQGTAKTVFLFQPIPTPLDFLRLLLTDLGFDAVGGDLVELQWKLNQVLLEQSRAGKCLILFIDEAQNLDGSVFELVRMLSNFETSREKLMQIILSGQPQLADKLAAPELEQLRQRVSIIAQLNPFSLEETKLYVQHRLRVAGYRFEAPLFTDSAFCLIATHSEGVPRNINNLCFNALSLGCALKRRTIDTDIVLEVLGDLDLRPLRAQSRITDPPAEKAMPAASRWVVSGAEMRTLRSRILKSGIAAVALIALGWALVRVHNGGKKPIEIQANVAAPHPELAEKVQNPTGPQPGTLNSSTPGQTDALQGQAAPAKPEASISQASTPAPRHHELQHELNRLSEPSGGQAAPISTAQALPSTVDSIRVTQGETLYGVCIEQRGSCSSKDLKQIRMQIRRLNPWIKDPNHLEPGQTIRIPFR